MAITLDEVRYTQNQSDNNAKSDRRGLTDCVGVGVVGRNDFSVTFSSGLTVSVSAGTAYVRGLSTAAQGMYRAYLSTAGTVTLPTAHATLPRIDQICLIVQDSNEDAGASNTGIIDVIPGTATSAADLDNRNGAATLSTRTSPTIIRLADCLVNPANSPAFGAGNIRDRRPYAIRGSIPALTSDIDIVSFIPTPGVNFGVRKINGTDHASHQAAALMYLPRRIAATRLRWHYQQDGTNVVSSGQSYKFAVCDASGRSMLQTAAVNFQGAVNDNISEVLTFTLNSELPSGYVFEAGNYYVWFGISGIGASNAFYTVSADCDTAASGHVPNTHNQFYRSSTGGTTFPAAGTMLSLADVGGIATPSLGILPVPVPAFSIG